ncbi:hypothetical protein O3Q51_16475 [Cryomorphaceae bacterium 1068]|nr:hypothetical protein [Cryomorphaceae bacterium 1068]
MSKFPPLKLRDVSSFHIALLSALWMVCFSATNLNGQSVPEAINYQAIVRDASTFLPISDQGAYVSVEFLDGPNGDLIYQEEFSSIQTGKAGLINLSLGQGNPLINSFSEIPWESGKIWLRLSVDVGNGLNILQEAPFNTVPYAFYAKSSGSNSPDGDGDSTNELIEAVVLEGTNLLITEGDQTNTVELSSLRQDEDADPLNEIQSLSLNGTSLSISGNESSVDLSELPGLGLDSDSDPSNELQELELEDNSLSISNSPSNSQVDLSSYLDNTDNQDLALSGTTLTLSGDVTPVDLSTLPGIGDDADADPSNEIQDLSLSGNTLSLSDDGTTVDLSGYLDNTDNQDLTLSGSTLSLTGDGTTVDLSNVPGIGDDADADPTNEIQDLSISGSTLSLSGDGTTVDLSTLPGLGDDADADPSNEIQDLSLSGSTLSLSGDGTTVDLSPYDQSDLSQGFIFIGNGSDKASQVEVFGDLILDDTGETKVSAIMGTDVSAVPPTDGQVLVYNATDSEWQPQSSPSVTPSATTSFYSIDPLDFRELTDNEIGVDLEEHNALKFFDDDAPFAMLRNTGIIEIMAPIHLPHGATINNLKVYYRDFGPGNMRFSLYRKNMTNFSVGNEVLTAVLANGPSGDRELDIDITNLNEIDNSIYSYRLYVRFSALEGDDAVDVDSVEQGVYGAVIEYATN